MAEITALSEIDGRTKLAKRLKADAARRQEIATGLLADLNRPANTTDRIWAQNLAVLVWRAEQLEEIGKDTTELRRLINQSMRAGGQKPAPPAPAKPDPGKNLEDIFAGIVSERTWQCHQSSRRWKARHCSASISAGRAGITGARCLRGAFGALPRYARQTTPPCCCRGNIRAVSSG